jgi:oligosaccharyl transferase complex subunit OST4
MITDGQLYQLAIFFGVAAMLLILVYHFLEVNAPKSTVASGKEGGSKSLWSRIRDDCSFYNFTNGDIQFAEKYRSAFRRTLRKIEQRTHNRELGLDMTRSGAV